MFKGHTNPNDGRFDIYSLSRDLIREYKIDVNLLVDFGSRHGESLHELGASCKKSAGFIFVEPAPRCIEKIRKLMGEYSGDLQLRLIEGVLAYEDGLIKFHTFENDDDQSANIFSDRDGRYGKSSVIDVPVFSYDAITARFPGRRIDFAKINIEGAEYAMLEGSFVKDRVDAFVMELHNQHVPGRTWRDAVDALSSDFDLWTHGNMDYKYCFMSGVRCK